MTTFPTNTNICPVFTIFDSLKLPKPPIRNTEMLKLVGKAVYVLVLLTVFVYLVGYDSVKKYLEEETFFSEKKIFSDLSKPPAVSLMVQNLNGHGGWKPDISSSSPDENIDEDVYIPVFCNTSEEYSKVVDCIDNNMYPLGETILEINNGNKWGNSQNLR